MRIEVIWVERVGVRDERWERDVVRIAGVEEARAKGRGSARCDED